MNALPALDMSNLSASHLNARKFWEADFETNHKAFAEDMALGIARHVIEELGNALKDPYKRSISFENKLISNISLDITKSRAAEKLTNFAQHTKRLPPFNEWLTKFTDQTKQSDSPFFEESIEGVDQKYFENLMAIVGNLARIKLNEVLAEFKINDPNHGELQFKVEWLRKAEQQFSSVSGFRDNCLLIELWFNNEARIPSHVEEKSSGAIEKYKVQQKKLERTRTINNIIFTMTVVIIGLLILNLGNIKINLPNR